MELVSTILNNASFDVSHSDFKVNLVVEAGSSSFFLPTDDDKDVGYRSDRPGSPLLIRCRLGRSSDRVSTRP